MLIEIRAYLQQQGATSLEELGRHFKVAPDAMRGMLEQWVRRGRVKKMAGPVCSGCTQCPPEKLEFYQWLEQGEIPLSNEPVKCNFN